jgi:hypothetical protein
MDGPPRRLQGPLEEESVARARAKVGTSLTKKSSGQRVPITPWLAYGRKNEARVVATGSDERAAGSL